MKCPHCTVVIHEDWEPTRITISEKNGQFASLRELFSCLVMRCPSCLYPIVLIKANAYSKGFLREGFVLPRNVNSLRLSDDISSDENLKELVEIYYEAEEVLPISPKASAALSRRILQTILEREGYEEKNLAKQVDAAVSETNPERSLPSYIRETVDYIRQVGNFAAHRITDKNTLEIIDVEPGEAEWCLEIVRSLFDHYYVQPANSKRKKAALDEKLQAAGKKPSK